MRSATSFIALASLAAGVRGHAVISAVLGANGVQTLGMGVTNTVPRTGTTEQPFQLDTPVLKNLKDDPCGATLLAGSVNIPAAMTAALAQGGGALPSFAADGSIQFTLHQVNADGGGPFTAMVNTDATGASWIPASVLVQAPGINGILHGGPADVPFTAQIPAGTKCTGGADGATCLIRLNNGGTNNSLSLAQGAGPFGGCAAVTQAGGAAAAGGAAGAAAAGNAAGAGAAAAGAAGTAGVAGAAGAASVAGAAGAAGAAAAAAGKKAGKGKGKGRKGGRAMSRHFYGSIEERAAAVESFRRSRILDDIAFLVSRGELTTDLIDEIKTATGTAIDIPIDMLAGQNDAADLGGNSSTAANAPITLQQAVDLKKAVQDAIATALNVLSSGGKVVAVNGLPLAQTGAANAEADAELASGQLTSINAGNAGVGFFQTAAVDSLLGPLASVQGQSTATIAAAGNLNPPAATATAVAVNGAAAAPTAAPAAANGTGRGGRKGGKFGGKFGGKRPAMKNRMTFD
ncbi:unnamed protein product [Mycena citricolor]|uniref:Uncharacterized protein n=1 Tax=Mycena citricolor TaxID=2018698 RepID=A0AAD2HSZ6_9AGAR|nr:unnamed protein product [Mycena citricolor]